MNNSFRCQCKKIVCQIEGDVVIIMCRHCKRCVHIETAGIKNITYKLTDQVDEYAARDNRIVVNC